VLIFFICLLIALFLLDALRLRGRLLSLPVLPSASDTAVVSAREQDADYLFLLAPGVLLEEETRRRVCSYMMEHQLDLLDLIPQDLAAPELTNVLQNVDGRTYQGDEFAQGFCSSQAMVLSPGLRHKANLSSDHPTSPAELVALARRLRPYAGKAAQLLIVPQLSFHAFAPSIQRAWLQEVIGRAFASVLGLQGLLLALLILCPYFSPLGGALLIAAYHVQALIIGLGGPLRPQGLWGYACFRLPWEVVRWLRTIFAPRREDSAPTGLSAQQARAAYEELLKEGLDPFFEPRQTSCPICHQTSLVPFLRTIDLLQRKPGRFTLERCIACGHLFQNPRLSVKGLNFYYKDFYDGLGEKDISYVFSTASRSYIGRATLVQGILEPRRWLDVGAGHGHFCKMAKSIWPQTRFDGLDLSESVEEAKKRGWVEKAYRGLFPELSSTLSGRYDLVSMHHYLEHTRDPRRELLAANEVLSYDGALLIELPNPQSLLGKVLGRFWLPWFQPQHQHLLSIDNLRRLLEECGFSLTVCQTTEAHQRVDFTFAAFLFLNWLAPQGAERPWRKATSLGKKISALVWMFGLPWVLLFRLVDRIVERFARGPHGSNTYRILACKKRPLEEAQLAAL
jgi:SAM-dependent methyltransferase